MIVFPWITVRYRFYFCGPVNTPKSVSTTPQRIFHVQLKIFGWECLVFWQTDYLGPWPEPKSVFHIMSIISFLGVNIIVILTSRYSTNYSTNLKLPYTLGLLIFAELKHKKTYLCSLISQALRNWESNL